MKIKVINKSKHNLSGYSTEASAGMDLAEWESVDALLDTERGSGGFGHTGKK
jgi:dUTPase